MPVRVEITPKLQPKETEFFLAIEDAPAGAVVGYGGAKGGGKSHGLRAAQVGRRIMYPGTTGLIFRRTYDDLWQNHIVKFLEEYPDLAGFYSAEHKTVDFPNGSKLLFRAADTKKDILQFRGKEYGDVAIDEATEQDEEDVKILFTSCRSPTSYRPKKFLTFNPGGVGHGFCKRVFIDQQLTEDEKRTTYLFIPAFAWDNVFWVIRALEEQGISKGEYFDWPETQRRDFFLQHGDYAQELLGLPEVLQQAWLWGRWDVFAGQYFHPPFQTYEDGEVEFESYLPEWAAIDWGFGHDSACHWFKAADNRIYIDAEYCANEQTPEKLAQEFVDRNGGRKIDRIFLSPDAFAKRTSPRTIAIEMGDVFEAAGLPRPTLADNDRVGGWALMNQLHVNGQLQINRGCRKLLKILPELIYDEAKAKEGDILKVLGDDPADSARYGIKSQKHVVAVPLKFRVAARAKAMKLDEIDLHSRAIHMRRLLAEEKGKGAPILLSKRMTRARMRRR